jgi:hypothetical protein
MQVFRATRDKISSIRNDDEDHALRCTFAIETGFGELCMAGTVREVASFCREFGVDARMMRGNRCYAMYAACGSGNLDVVKYIAHAFSADDILPRIETGTFGAFSEALRRAHRNVAKWLLAHYRLQNLPDAASRAQNSVYYSASNLANVRWLYGIFGAGCVQVGPGLTCALRATGYSSAYDVAEWLLVTFGVAALAPSFKTTYIDACESGNCEFAEWLAGKMCINARALFELRIYALIRAVNYGPMSAVNHLAQVADVGSFTREAATILHRRYAVFDGACERATHLLDLVGRVPLGDLPLRPNQPADEVAALIAATCMQQNK